VIHAVGMARAAQWSVRQVKARAITLFSGVALAAVASCRGPGATVGSDASLTSAVVPSAAVTDEAVTNAVRRLFSQDSRLQSQAFSVSTQDGSVTVAGSASTLVIKECALKTPKTLAGVRAVIDAIQVATSAKPDAILRLDIAQAIQGDPAVRTLPVTIDVKAGVVTLGGSTDSWQERRLIEQDASAISGVVAVEDRLTVPYPGWRPDAAIEADVWERLSNDVWLENTSVRTNVSNGLVTLGGEVATVAQRERAYDDAWTLDVLRVDDSQLRVSAGRSASVEPRATVPPAAPSGSRVLSATKQAFRYDPRVAGAPVALQLQDHTLTLSGTVDDVRARQSALRDASDTIGVTSVIDDMKVVIGVQPEDTSIVKAVQKRLARDPDAPDANRLGVRSLNGDVTVSGEIDSAVERGAVLRDIAEVPDVQRVTDAMTSSIAPDVLGARIKDLFAWDPLVHGEDIHVEVDAERVATLTGTACAVGARAAFEDAKRLGARSVEDRVKVACERGTRRVPP
jgi:osmotically-inducible protein OsmY